MFTSASYGFQIHESTFNSSVLNTMYAMMFPFKNGLSVKMNANCTHDAVCLTPFELKMVLMFCKE